MRTLGLWTLLLLASSATGATDPPTTRTPADCAAPGLRGVLCGTLAVPENRSRPDGGFIELSVQIVPAVEPDRTRPPLVILEGGPGAAVSTNLGMYALSFAGVRQRRDLVFVDLRGTGRSAPLSCDSIADRASVASCADSLRARHDPAAFHTAAVVEDLEAVRRWLGHDRWNLFGVSYGTRVALAFTKAYPDRVAAAALLAPYPLDRNVALDAARIADASLRGVVEACEQDAACSAAYPELSNAVDTLGRRLIAGETIGTVSATDFTGTLRYALFSSLATAQLPLILTRAAAGDLAPFEQLRSGLTNQTASWISSGTLLSTLCAEDFSRVEPDEIVAASSGSSFFGPWWSLALERSCAVWPHHRPPAEFWRPKEGSTPLLLLAGGLDPAMDPAWAQDIADRNARAQAVVIPQAQHSLLGLSNVFCALGLVQRFVDAPGEPLDASCVETMRRPPFVLPR